MTPKAALAITPLLVLAACAYPVPHINPPKWTKPGGTAPEFRKDRGYCIAQSGAVPVVEQGTVFKGCMEGRGWIDEANPE